MTTYRRQMLQSMVAFFIAITVTVLWHELAHGLMARMLGYDPVVFSGREEDAATSSGDAAMIAAAGPLVSLVTGMMLLALVSRQRPGTRPGSLLMAWLALLGLETFVGYLLTAVFYGDGDVARILDELRAPAPASLVVLLAGIAGLLVVARVAVSVFFQLAPQVPERPTDLRLYLRQVAVLPWLAGVVLAALASLPWDSPTGLIAVATSGLFTLLAMGLTARSFCGLATARRERINSPAVVALAAAALALVVIDRLVFRSGLHL